MELLVGKLLHRYLSAYIKNYSSKNFVNWELRDLEFKEEVIQDVLSLPPNLIVKRVHCNSIRVKIPWKRLRHSPIVFYLDQIHVDLAEPPVLRKLKKKKEKEASKRGFAAKLIEGLQLEINELQLSIQTLGKDKSGVIGPSSPPLLKLQVKNVLVQSTNSKWEVVDLTEAAHETGDTSSVMLYKELRLGSVSLILVHHSKGPNAPPDTLLADVPIRSLFKSKKDALTGTTLFFQLDLIVERLCVAISQPQYHAIQNVIEGILHCFSRGTAEGPASVDNDDTAAAANADSDGNAKQPTAQRQVITITTATALTQRLAQSATPIGGLKELAAAAPAVLPPTRRKRKKKRSANAAATAVASTERPRDKEPKTAWSRIQGIISRKHQQLPGVTAIHGTGLLGIGGPSVGIMTRRPVLSGQLPNLAVLSATLAGAMGGSGNQSEGEDGDDDNDDHEDEEDESEHEETEEKEDGKATGDVSTSVDNEEDAFDEAELERQAAAAEAEADMEASGLSTTSTMAASAMSTSTPSGESEGDDLTHSAYNFVVRGGTIDFQEEVLGAPRGLAQLAFRDFRCHFVPAVPVDVSVSTGGDTPRPDGATQLEAQLVVGAFSLKELLPSRLKHPDYTTVLSGGSMSTSTPGLPPAFSVRYIMRPPITPDGDTPRPPGYATREASVVVDTVRMVFDRDVLKRLHGFLLEGGPAKPLLEDMVEQNLDNMLEACLYDYVRFRLEARKPAVVLPPYAGHRGPPHTAAAVLTVTADKLLLASCDPDSTHRPAVFAEGLFVAPASQFPCRHGDFTVRTAEDDDAIALLSKRFRMVFKQVSVDMAEHPTALPVRLLDPVDLRTHITFRDFATLDATRPRLEFCFHLSAIRARMNKHHYEYFLHVVDERLAWSTAVLHEHEERAMARMMEELLAASASGRVDRYARGLAEAASIAAETVAKVDTPLPYVALVRVETGSFQLFTEDEQARESDTAAHVGRYGIATASPRMGDGSGSLKGTVLAEINCQLIEVVLESHADRSIAKLQMGQMQIACPIHAGSPFSILVGPMPAMTSSGSAASLTSLAANAPQRSSVKTIKKPNLQFRRERLSVSLPSASANAAAADALSTFPKETMMWAQLNQLQICLILTTLARLQIWFADSTSAYYAAADAASQSQQTPHAAGAGAVSTSGTAVAPVVGSAAANEPTNQAASTSAYITQYLSSQIESDEGSDWDVDLISCELLVVETPDTPECVPMEVQKARIQRRGLGPLRRVIEFAGTASLFSYMIEQSNFQRELLCSPFNFQATYGQSKSKRSTTIWRYDTSLVIENLEALLSRQQFIMIMNVFEHQLDSLKDVGKLNAEEESRIQRERDRDSANFGSRYPSTGDLHTKPPLDHRYAAVELSPSTISSPSSAVTSDTEEDDDTIPRNRFSVSVGRMRLQLRNPNSATKEEFARIDVSRLAYVSEDFGQLSTMSIKANSIVLVDLRASGSVPRFRTIVRPKDVAESTPATLDPADLFSLTWDQFRPEMATKKSSLKIPWRNRWTVEIAPFIMVYVPDIFPLFRDFFALLNEQKNLRKQYQVMQSELKSLFSEGLMADEPNPSAADGRTRRHRRHIPTASASRGSVATTGAVSRKASSSADNTNNSVLFKVLLKESRVLLPEQFTESLTKVIQVDFDAVFVNNDNDSIYHADVVSKTDYVITGFAVSLKTLDTVKDSVLQKVEIVSPASLQLTISAKHRVGADPFTHVHLNVSSAVSASISLNYLQTMYGILAKTLVNFMSTSATSATASPAATSAAQRTDRMFEVSVHHVDMTMVSDYVAGLPLFYVYLKDLEAVVGLLEHSTDFSVTLGLEALLNNLNYRLPEPFVEPFHVALTGSKSTATGEGEGTVIKLDAIVLDTFAITVTKELLRHLMEIADLLKSSWAANAPGAEQDHVAVDHVDTAPTAKKKDELLIEGLPAPPSPPAAAEHDHAAVDMSTGRKPHHYTHFQYILCNKTEADVIYRQAASLEAKILPAATVTSFSFTNPYQPPLLEFQLVGGWSSTDPFPLDTPCSKNIIIRFSDAPTLIDKDAATAPTVPASAGFSELHFTRELVVTIKPKGLKRFVEILSIHRIRNATDEPLEVEVDTGPHGPRQYTVAPGSQQPIGFDESWRAKFRVRFPMDWQWSEPFTLPYNSRQRNQLPFANISAAIAARRSPRSTPLGRVKSIPVVACDELGNVRRIVLVNCSRDHKTGVVTVTFVPPLVLHNLTLFPLEYRFCDPTANAANAVDNGELDLAQRGKVVEGGIIPASSRKCFYSYSAVGDDVVSAASTRSTPSYTTAPLRHIGLAFRLLNYTEWSKPIDVDGVGMRTAEISGKKSSSDRRSVSLNVFRVPRLGRLARAVYVNTEFLFVNNTAFVLLIRQRGARNEGDVLTLAPKERKPFSWAATGPRQVHVKVANADWSAGLNIYLPSVSVLAIHMPDLDIAYELIMEVRRVDEYCRVVTWTTRLHLTNQTRHDLLLRAGREVLPVTANSRIDCSLAGDRMLLSLPRGARLQMDQKAPSRPTPLRRGGPSNDDLAALVEDALAAPSNAAGGDAEWTWESFSLTTEQTVTLQIKDRTRSDRYLAVDVTVKIEERGTYIYITDSLYPPYVVCNLTPYTLRIARGAVGELAFSESDLTDDDEDEVDADESDEERGRGHVDHGDTAGDYNAAAAADTPAEHQKWHAAVGSPPMTSLSDDSAESSNEDSDNGNEERLSISESLSHAEHTGRPLPMTTGAGVSTAADDAAGVTALSPVSTSLSRQWMDIASSGGYRRTRKANGVAMATATSAPTNPMAVSAKGKEKVPNEPKSAGGSKRGKSKRRVDIRSHKKKKSTQRSRKPVDDSPFPGIPLHRSSQRLPGMAFRRVPVWRSASEVMVIRPMETRDCFWHELKDDQRLVLKVDRPEEVQKPPQAHDDTAAVVLSEKPRPGDEEEEQEEPEKGKEKAPASEQGYVSSSSSTAAAMGEDDDEWLLWSRPFKVTNVEERKVRFRKQYKLKSRHLHPHIYMSIRSRGKTKLLTFGHLSRSGSGQRDSLRPMPAMPPGLGSVDTVLYTVRARLPSLDIKLLAESGQEILRGTVREVNGNYYNHGSGSHGNGSSTYTYTYFYIADMQFDNMLPSAEFPVLLAVNAQKLYNFKANILEVLFEASGREFRVIEYCGVRLLPLLVKIDGELLNVYHNMMAYFRPKSTDDDADDDEPTGADGGTTSYYALPEDDDTAPATHHSVAREVLNKMYIERLEIFPVDITLCIGDNELGWPVIGEETPLQLAEFRRTDTYDTQENLLHVITKSYVRIGWFELTKIIASLDAIGSPWGAIQKLLNGCKDFVYIPATSLVLDDTPGAFIFGIWRGSASFIKNLTDASLTTLWKVLSTMSWMMVKLTFDKEFQRKKLKVRRRHPRNLGSGIVQGSIELARDMIEGIAAIPLQMYHGIKHSGAAGVFAGLGRGLLEMPLRPVIGVMDFFGKTIEGFLHSLGSGYTPVRRIHEPNAGGIAGAAAMFPVGLLQQWPATGADRYIVHFAVKCVTKRGRLRDRILVLMAHSFHLVNPRKLAETDYQPLSIPLMLISEIIVPRIPETNFIIALKRIIRNRERIRFVVPDRRSIIEKFVDAVQQYENEELAVQEDVEMS